VTIGQQRTRHRRETSLEALASFQPAFSPVGRSRSGNASKLNDGGAAVIVRSVDRARELGGQASRADRGAGSVRARARAVSSPHPRAPFERCLEKAGWKSATWISRSQRGIQRIECVRRELEIPDAKSNVNGGAVALGHPIGASGARPARDVALRAPRALKETGALAFALPRRWRGRRARGRAP